MTGMRHLTDPAMFERFHKALTSERQGYTPWYFLLSKGLKDPVAGISWKQLEGRLSFEQALKKMRAGHNIGIAATGMDPLCIVDIDDITATPDEIVKPTLTTRSRKRIGRHYFYFTDDPRCKENLPTDSKGEIRSSFEYVVAPGSFVLCDGKTIAAMPDAQRECAGRYTVENERSPDTIVFDELPPVFLEQAKKNREAERETKKRREETAKARKDKKPAQGNDKNRSVMWDLSIEDIMSIPNKTRFKSLFHESTTGKNTALNDDGGLTCWRHLVTHTPLSALAVLAGVSDCNSAGQGFNRGKSSCIDYADGATLWKMWAFAKHEGMIPKDDPIPSGALRWCAVDQGICKAEEITDGWKLPFEAYQQTLALVETKEGISSGRTKAPSAPETASEKNGVSPDMFLVGDQKVFDVNGFSKWLIYESGRTFATFSDTEEVLQYGDGIYQHGGDIEIGKLVEHIMDGYKVTKNAVNEIIGHVRRRTYVERVEFDSDKNVINLANGLYDMRTGTLMPHTSEHLSMHKSPVVYDPEATCPRIDRFFEEVLLEKHVPFMYELFGYSLLKEKQLDTAVLFEGSGANGKSRMIGLLDAFAGSGVTAHVTPSELSGEDKFAVADLFGKLLNTIDDLGNTPLKNLGVFKSIISGAEQRGQYKYEKAFKFTPTVLCVFGCNEVPVTTDTSDGFFRRMITVPFLQQFDGDTADKNLFSKLTTPAELSGLFNKAMGAVSVLLDDGKFTCVGTIEDRKQAYLYASNPAARFCDEYCSFSDPDDYISKNELYNQYVMWSRGNCFRVKTKGVLTTHLEGLGCVVRQFTDDDNMRYRAYVGVRMKTGRQACI